MSNSESRRSWLVVPANKPDEIAQAVQSGADVVVLDRKVRYPKTESAAELRHR